MQTIMSSRSMVLIRGEEYDATVEIRKIKEKLALHRNDLHAILHESETTNNLNNASNNTTANASASHLEDGHGHESANNAQHAFRRFQPREMLDREVAYPFVVILVLMFLLQFSGQGAVTFYTALIFEEAEASVSPKDCAFIIGFTYFLSSLLGLVLKKHFGRRPLLLISELGMGVSQLALGVYFYMLKHEDLGLDP